MTMTRSEPEITELMARARAGDRSAVGALLESQRARLERMLAPRFHGRLGVRVDVSDVIQDVFLEASGRMEDYFRAPEAPFFYWLLYLATQRLQMVYRRHLGTQKRDARREVSLDAASPATATSGVFAGQLPGKASTPSQSAVRTELRARVRETLEGMDTGDREVIALRHFEELR